MADAGFCEPVKKFDADTATAVELNDWYENQVGYRPQVDDLNMSDADLRELVRGYIAEILGHE
jgi:hypothetical protein